MTCRIQHRMHELRSSGIKLLTFSFQNFLCLPQTWTASRLVRGGHLQNSRQHLLSLHASPAKLYAFSNPSASSEVKQSSPRHKSIVYLCAAVPLEGKAGLAAYVICFVFRGSGIRNQYEGFSCKKSNFTFHLLDCLVVCWSLLRNSRSKSVSKSSSFQLFRSDSSLSSVIVTQPVTFCSFITNICLSPSGFNLYWFYISALFCCKLWSKLTISVIYDLCACSNIYFNYRAW